MILNTFTQEEVEKEISKDYAVVYNKLVSQHKPYSKDFKKRRKPIYYTTPVIVKHNNNTFIGIFGSPTSSLKDFGMQVFLRIESGNRRIYYRILADGRVVLLTKHFIDRFIERSPYNCNKDNFLVYLSKDLCTPMTATTYSASKSGLVIFKNYAYITYITDLSKIKERIKEGAGKFATDNYTRGQSMAAVLNLIKS